MFTLKEEKSHEIIHYKKYHKLKDIIKNKNPNIIVYGVSNSGKSFLINYILKNLFGEYRSIIEYKISFKRNKNYYIFDFSNHLRHIIIKKIESIVRTYDHYNKMIKYIIIDNYNNIPDILQKNIKVFIEKYSDNARFILLTNKLFSIEKSICSSCFNIKINKPNKYDKYIYFKYIFDKNNIKYNSFLLLKNCEKYEIDHISKMYYKNDIFFINIYEKINRQINEVMNNTFNIDEIKKISINIKELNLNITQVLINFLENSPYSQHKKGLLIKEIANYNYIIKKAYRDIISIESLLIKIFQILNYE